MSLAWADPKTDEIVSVAFPFDQRGDKVAQQTLLGEASNLDRREWEALLDWLDGRKLVFHNAKFDLHFLRVGTRHWAGWDLLESLHWDTMVAAREIEPTESIALKGVAERWALTGGGERNEEQIIKQYLKKAKLPKGRYDLVPWDIIGPYAAADTDLTLRLYYAQQASLEVGEGNPRWVRHELRKLATLYRMESAGIGFDVDACRNAADALRQEANRLAATLPFTPNVNAAKRYFFKERGILPYEVTANGQPQLDSTVLRRMVGDDIEWAAEYQEWRHIDNALSMWYDGYPDKVGEDGRLRCSYRQTHVVSGRMSVERVQLHAIPHQSKLTLPAGTPTPRQFFGPADGYRLWEVDLAQAELRVAAAMAKCELMLELVRADADVHGETAKALFDTDEQDERWFYYRQIAKRSNFSFIFGVGWRKFQAMIYTESGTMLSDTEAQNIVERWKRLYPEFARAIRSWERFALEHRYVPLTNGRKRWFGFGEFEHKAFNQRVQGSLAEFANHWMIWADDLVRAEGGRVILTVHDSVVIETPEELGDGLARGVAELAAERGTRWFKVPFGADYAEWGEH